MKKSIFSLLMALVMMLSLVPSVAFAADIVASGNCGAEGDGSNLTWTLDDAGTLTISGTGKMEDYGSFGLAPWHRYGSAIKSVNIDEGVTSIGKYAFYNCNSLTDVYYSGSAVG